jgi:hypothetical protein
MTAAQAWADGGVPNPWATAAGASGWFYDAEAHLGRFVNRHRELFARRERCANVGLVYSLPTHAWRQFRAFKLTPGTYRHWFGVCARFLEESHVPYEANCWSHPLLGDDTIALARLQRYKVLVLPGVDCFSDAQRAAVRAFQARGGRVLSVATPKYYDADAVVRPAGDTLAAPGPGLIEIAPALLSRYSPASVKNAPSPAESQAAGVELQAILRRTLADDQMLDSNSPASVWANLWLDDTRQVLALHLVNGDIDVAADRFRPAEGSRWRIRLPAGLAVSQAMAFSPDGSREPAAAQPLPVEVAGGWATVVVPRLESYTIVAFYRGEALTAASHVAAARRARWRASLRGDAVDAEFPARLDKVLTLLRAGRLDQGEAALTGGK